MFFGIKRKMGLVCAPPEDSSLEEMDISQEINGSHSILKTRVFQNPGEGAGTLGVGEMCPSLDLSMDSQNLKAEESVSR